MTLTRERLPLLANLEAYTGVEGETVKTGGRTAMNDGGGGTFVWDASITSAVFSLDTLKGVYVYADGKLTDGCWVRQFDGSEVDPIWYGAVGNGVANKVADTAAFAAAAASGMDIVVNNQSSAGYFVSGVTRLTQSVRGIGMPKITISKDITYDNTALNDGEAQIFRYLNHFTETEITGIHFVGDFDGVGVLTEHAHAIAISSSSYKKVYNCIFDDQYGDGVYIGKFDWTGVEPAINDISDYIEVFNNKFDNPRRCATAFVGARYCDFHNNYATKQNIFVALLDIEPNLGDGTYVKDISIRDNFLKSTSTVIGLYAPVSGDINNVEISGNTIDSDGSAIVSTSGTSNTAIMLNVTIRDNRTSVRAGQTMTYFLLIRNPIDHFRVVNNTDYACGRWTLLNQIWLDISGNYLNGDFSVVDSGIEIRDSTNFKVQNNFFENLTFVSSTLGCISILKSVVDAARVSNFIISGNKAIGCTNFLTFAHLTEVAANSLICEEGVVANNQCSVTGNAYIYGAETTVTRTAFKANQIDTGTVSMAKYDPYGARLEITTAPEFLGQVAVVAGVPYIAKGTTLVADWVAV